MTNRYDNSSKESILRYARELLGSSLREKLEADWKDEYDQFLVDNKRSKGRFGLMLEQLYFDIPQNNNPTPDFTAVDLELKATPLKVISGGDMVSKERVVLGIIDYQALPSQEFEESDFWRKNKEILFVFYLFEKAKLPIEYVIKLVDIWSLVNSDFKEIKADWETIRRKVSLGLAHELSEKDTLYLSACTKGASKATLRDQHNSLIRAKQRAFSFKQSYVNHIAAVFAQSQGLANTGRFVKLLQNNQVMTMSDLKEMVFNRFRPHYGKSLEQLSSAFGVRFNISAKGFAANLTNKILNVELGSRISEFEKTGLTVKSVRLGLNGLPEQNVSFPAFEYLDFPHTNWEDSDFKDQIERPFMFVFFKKNGESYFLDRVVFWSIPVQDVELARKAWISTKWLVMHGKIRLPQREGKSLTYFPMVRNRIFHVRPHGNNSKDCFDLPKPDKATGALKYTKHSFWMNAMYVKSAIYDPSCS